MKQSSTIISGWYIKVYEDGDNKKIFIANSDVSSKLWVTDLNPEGYQRVATIDLNDFATHEGYLIIPHSHSMCGGDWYMPSRVVFDAQGFIHDLGRNAK